MNEILAMKAIVQLPEARQGFWDGGAKSRFEFTPSIERTPGVPAIRWGSYAANLWFVVPFKSRNQHLRALRTKLRGNDGRTITIE